jgi:hypothetical protein
MKDQSGHEYRILNVDGTSYHVSARHRKDCAHCVLVRARITPRQTLPKAVDMSTWEAKVCPIMVDVQCTLQQAVEAQEQNPALTGHFLQKIGKTLRNLPASPDGGLESEYLAQAGDAFLDAEYAFRLHDDEAAAGLILKATRLMTRAAEQGEACSA